MDGRLDAVAATSFDTVVARLAIALVCGPLLAINLGLAVGGLWILAYLVAETWSWMACRPAMGGRRLTRRQRLNYLVSLATSGAVWTASGVLYWQAGTEPLRLAAFAVLAGVLVHAQCFCFRAPLALAVLAVQPAATLLILALGRGGYSGVPLITVGVMLALLLTYVAASAQANLKSATALEDAQKTAEAANEAKSAFLAMTSHELRTPLNGVLGMARALRRTDLDALQQGYVDTIMRSGDGLLAILNDVLDLSKIEAGRMDLEVAAFDLRQLGAQAVHLWSEQASVKGLELVCEADPDLPARVLGDEMRVRQVVLNLISNALKFTDRGAVRLVLSAEPAAHGDGGVAISIIDTGMGMTPEQLVGLFRPFAQAEASTARQYGGTGLGLAISRKLVARMGGEIRVESAAGRGSTFRVWLPLPPAEAASSSEADTAVLPPVRILVADDNPINRAVARALLEATGATVEMACDGVETLERLRIEAFDVVLMDVHMPNMDGIEAVGRIRAGQAGRPDIPIVALTADATPGEDARLKALGFDALEHKPVQPGALVAAIAEVLGRRQHADEAAA
ncbi:ATP-binding protein [Phenylobacterium sp.]|uniref:ATP-binding protein n=1 Tax=Phenylobacterium sp. TaxID=1871053 RepID=UPI0025DAE963|nr:ATP-binding protein [Phenylobacterium sp.]